MTGAELHRRAPTQASMPIRHGGIATSRASTCPRDHLCRSTIAPRRSEADDVERILVDIDAHRGKGRD
jgi:hypothetical protein